MPTPLAANPQILGWLAVALDLFGQLLAFFGILLALPASAMYGNGK
jgi:hypothetical protein